MLALTSALVAISDLICDHSFVTLYIRQRKAYSVNETVSSLVAVSDAFKLCADKTCSWFYCC